MKYLLSITTLVFIALCVTSSSAVEITYTVPDELKPMSTWRNGWSAEETRKYRQEYNDNTMTGGEDDGIDIA